MTTVKFAPNDQDKQVTFEASIEALSKPITITIAFEVNSVSTSQTLSAMMK